jgi:tRNA splicing endonuclease
MEHGILEVIHENKKRFGLHDLLNIANRLSEPLMMERIFVYLDLFRLGYVIMKAGIFLKLKNQPLEKYPALCRDTIYFLWIPSRKESFKRKEPDIPDYCLLVVSSNAKPNSSEEFQTISSNIKDVCNNQEPTILLAIVDEGNVITWIQCNVSNDVLDIRNLE